VEDDMYELSENARADLEVRLFEAGSTEMPIQAVA